MTLNSRNPWCSDQHRIRLQPCCLAVVWLALIVSGTGARAGVPDLTRGDKPTPLKKSTKLLIGNLGPTGLKGWVYDQRSVTKLSRQILITEVAPGSPADGVLKVGDVILGASGNGTNPSPFTADARKSFALAIADAEARNPARLQMTVWREDKTSTLFASSSRPGSGTTPSGSSSSTTPARPGIFLMSVLAARYGQALFPSCNSRIVSRSTSEG